MIISRLINGNIETTDIPDNFDFSTQYYDWDEKIIKNYSETQRLQIKTETDKRKQKIKDAEIEAKNLGFRNLYMDAYRKYQAAVNYGEFEQSAPVDIFISRLKEKDWTALNEAPPQIDYFLGKVTFAQSGLIKKYS